MHRILGQRRGLRLVVDRRIPEILSVPLRFAWQAGRQGHSHPHCATHSLWCCWWTLHLDLHASLGGGGVFRSPTTPPGSSTKWWFNACIPSFVSPHAHLHCARTSTPILVSVPPSSSVHIIELRFLLSVGCCCWHCSTGKEGLHDSPSSFLLRAGGFQLASTHSLTRWFVPVAAYTSLDQVSALCWNNYNIFFRSSSSGKVTVIRNPNWIGKCKRDDGYGVPILQPGHALLEMKLNAYANQWTEQWQTICTEKGNHLHPPPQLVLCCVNVHVPTYLLIRRDVVAYYYYYDASESVVVDFVPNALLAELGTNFYCVPMGENGRAAS